MVRTAVGAALLPRLCSAGLAHAAAPAPTGHFPGSLALGRIEAESGGRLGVFAYDCGAKQGFGWRADERFAMCSTFKLSLAALALREIDAGRLKGDEMLGFSALDVLPNSPVTGAVAGLGGMGGGGLRVLDLAEAAVETGDNLAANLLLARLGGPGRVTAFWRELGDTVSRLDRTEMALNAVLPGEVHDTTAAAPLALALAGVLAGTVLSPASRERLLGWMGEATTGLARLRAGVPEGWWAGDKTGTVAEPGMATRINDIALLRPPAGAAGVVGPLVVTAFFEPAGAPQDIRPADEAVLAKVGRVVVDPASWALSGSAMTEERAQ